MREHQQCPGLAATTYQCPEAPSSSDGTALSPAHRGWGAGDPDWQCLPTALGVGATATRGQGLIFPTSASDAADEHTMALPPPPVARMSDLLMEKSLVESPALRRRQAQNALRGSLAPKGRAASERREQAVSGAMF